MQDIGLISHTFEKNSSVVYILNSISGVTNLKGKCSNFSSHAKTK